MGPSVSPTTKGKEKREASFGCGTRKDEALHTSAEAKKKENWAASPLRPLKRTQPEGERKSTLLTHYLNRKRGKKWSR